MVKKSSKKGQEQKSKILAVMPRKAQEEMVGFAMIIIIVAVILLVLLGISLNKPKTQGVKSYEVESFIQAFLQNTTECSTDFGRSYNDIEGLIVECDFEQICEDEKSACEVLNSDMESILEESWKTGPDRPVKGYILNVTSKDRIILSVNEGNITANYKGGSQPFPKRGVSYLIDFKVYY